MKSSQSNFNLWLPSSYLARSYLIATVQELYISGGNKKLNKLLNFRKHSASANRDIKNVNDKTCCPNLKSRLRWEVVKANAFYSCMILTKSNRWFWHYSWKLNNPTDISVQASKFVGSLRAGQSEKIHFLRQKCYDISCSFHQFYIELVCIHIQTPEF